MANERRHLAYTNSPSNPAYSPMNSTTTRIIEIGSMSLSAVFGCLAVWALFSASFLGAATFGMAGLVCYPHIRRELLAIPTPKLSVRSLVGVVAAFLAIGAIATFSAKREQVVSQRAVDESKLQASSARFVKASQDRANSTFARNRDSILASIEAKIHARAFTEAMAEAGAYTPQDAKLDELRNAAEAGAIRANLARANPLEKPYRAELLGRLAVLEPSNLAVAEEHRVLSANVARTIADDVENTRRASARAALEKRLFSGWDGSVPAVVSVIKASLRNPDSFVHVSTQHAVSKHGYVVTTTYRATNGFGAVDTYVVQAEIDDNGSIASSGGN